jgi:hypothetical protein
MPFAFSGVFCFSNDEAALQHVAAATAAKWPFAILRHVFEPLRGIAFGLPTDGLDQLQPGAIEVRAALPAFSTAFPEQELFYLESFHYGGPGVNNGYIVRNGVIRFEVTNAEEDNSGFEALAAAVPLALDGYYFEPLTRRYFSSGGYVSAKISGMSVDDLITSLQTAGNEITEASPGWYDLTYGKELFHFYIIDNEDEHLILRGKLPVVDDTIVSIVTRWAEVLKKAKDFNLGLFDTVGGRAWQFQ